MLIGDGTECAQLTITGSGSALPPASYYAPIPGAWGGESTDSSGQNAQG